MMLTHVILAASLAMTCGPYQATLDVLKEDSGVVPAYVGALGDDGLMVVLENPETKKFVIMIEPNDKTLCLFAAGSNWHAGVAPSY